MDYGRIVQYGSSVAGQWDRTDKIFLSKGKPVTWKGFSAFKLANLYDRGINIGPFLNYYVGYNVARVWSSVSWGSESWDFPHKYAFVDFCRYMMYRGLNVEFTLCTDAREDRIEQSKELLAHVNQENVTNLFLEAVNEPFIHDKLDPSLFKNLLTSQPYLYTSGIYTDTKKHYGKYWVDHSARDAEWFRKGGHNLYEATYTGGGPNTPDEPALRMPGVQDEPGKLQDLGKDLTGIYAYAASCVLIGAGATVHTETGKYCNLPTSDEQEWIASFRRGLDIFPAGTWNGSYRRIVEVNQPSYARTYCTDKYSIRIKQNGTSHPETGWTPMDEYGICWSR